MPSTTAEVIFIGGEYWPTQTGKDRWKLRANDGREFGVWDKGVYDGVMNALQQPLMCEVGSKQDDRGTWWNTLYAVPALGLAAAKAGGGGGGKSGTTVDITPLVQVLFRIADALENLVAFQVEQRLGKAQPVPTSSGDTGPDEPPADWS